MIRYLETFYRHKRLFVIPVIIALVFSLGFSAFQPQTYQASTRIWYDLNPAIGSSANSSMNQYVTPAEQQAEVLQELINTRAFGAKVAHRSPIDAYVTTPAGYAEAAGTIPGLKASVKTLLGEPGPNINPGYADDLADALITKNTLAIAVGPQIVLVTMTLHDATVATKTLRALIDQYSDEVLGDRKTQAQAAVAFWQQQVDQQGDVVDRSNAAVARYLSTHPQAAQDTASARSDPVLSALTLTESQDQQRYGSLMDKLDQAKLDLAASTNPAADGFRIIDPPLAAGATTTGLRKQVMVVGGGLLVGVLISLAGLVAMTLLDPTMRRTEDVKTVLGLRVVGTVPKIGVVNARPEVRRFRKLRVGSR